MDLKNTKIFIPEIPVEWTQRMRSGHTNIFNESFNSNPLEEVRLEPPQRGLYAERFEDGWYWVCGCHKCLRIEGRYSYIVCDEHNRCVSCGTHRKDLLETPWVHLDGFQCKPCNEKEHQERKYAALEKAKSKGHTEDDCWRTDDIICPVCASKNSDDDISDEAEVTCEVCDTEFVVEVHYEVSYTTTLKNS